MDLLNRLIAAGRQIPPSHLPSLNDLVHVVGALVLHVDHGPQFLQAAEQGEGAVAAFLDAVAQQENARVAQEQPQQQQPGQVAPSSIAGATPAAAAPPAAPVPVQAGVPVAEQATPPAGASAPLSDAEIVAQIESLQAQLADRQRTTITSA